MPHLSSRIWPLSVQCQAESSAQGGRRPKAVYASSLTLCSAAIHASEPGNSIHAKVLSLIAPKPFTSHQVMLHQFSERLCNWNPSNLSNQPASWWAFSLVILRGLACKGHDTGLRHPVHHSMESLEAAVWGA